MKTEALKLADELESLGCSGCMDGTNMIRRLVEELDKQCKPINHYEPTAWINHIKQTGGDFYELNVSGRGEPLYRHPPQTKPLSDEEIIRCMVNPDVYSENEKIAGIRFARAIEERHGIK